MANEKRLIDANAWESFYKEQLKGLERYDYYDEGYGDAINNVDDWMDAQPKVDAVPVVHGRWVRYEHGSGIYCSHCRHKRRYKDAQDSYCPNCGVQMMDGGNEDG